MRWRVLEVHNFGGFFGGDTVTLTASRLDDDLEETLTIDESALANLADRHHVAATMVFALDLCGDRVDRAELLGAADWTALEPALGAELPQTPLTRPQVRAYHCVRCDLWLLGDPDSSQSAPHCRLCGAPL